MPPEQVRGDVDVDARADVYALGCLLFQILARSMLHPPGKAGSRARSRGSMHAHRGARRTARFHRSSTSCASTRPTSPRQEDPDARGARRSRAELLDGDRDLALRQKLAADHLTRAQAAFAVGDDQRAIAMREASSAIALDPKLTAAPSSSAG